MDTIDLFEAGEYLDQRGPGYFAIAGKPSGQWHQHCYELQHLPAVVNGLNPAVDTWISQATFNARNRRAVNLESVGLLFADLDTYRNTNLSRRTPDEQTNMLLGYCSQNGIPTPSVVLFSGRGLQAKWLLTESLGPSSLMDWNAVQLALVDALADFGSDHNARDVSRVLRVDRTTNTKSGEVVRVVHVTGGVEAAPARYDFEELRECLGSLAEAVDLGSREPSLSFKHHLAVAPLSIPREMNLQRLNWFRLYDLRDLWKLRGGVPEGWREVTLFWELNFLLRADPGKVSDLFHEARSLAAQIDPGSGWWRESDLSTLFRKATAARAGESVEFHGHRYPPLYTPRNTTLITRFEITGEEMQQLRTIIDRDEKYRRKVEWRRAKGTRPQPYRDFKPWEELGISRRTWYRRQAQEGNPHKSRDKVCHMGGINVSK